MFLFFIVIGLSSKSQWFIDANIDVNPYYITDFELNVGRSIKNFDINLSYEHYKTFNNYQIKGSYNLKFLESEYQNIKVYSGVGVGIDDDQFTSQVFLKEKIGLKKIEWLKISLYEKLNYNRLGWYYETRCDLILIFGK